MKGNCNDKGSWFSQQGSSQKLTAGDALSNKKRMVQMSSLRLVLYQAEMKFIAIIQKDFKSNFDQAF